MNIPLKVDNLTLRSRCYEALTEAFRKLRPGVHLDGIGYVPRLEDNLLPGVDLGRLTSDFAAGAGQELKQKIRAPYSSSALVVNTFGRWAENPATLVLGGETDFKQLGFECQCRSGLGGTPPHLDLIAESDKRVIAVESKCTEYLSPKKADFSESYDGIQDGRSSTKWYEHLIELKRDPYYYHWLDGAQLIKHYLGIAHTFAKPATLIYLYWQPTNWSDYTTFIEHRMELESFGRRVADDGGVRFVSQSYDELWNNWVKVFDSGPVRDHIANCQRRYSVALSSSPQKHAD